MGWETLIPIIAEYGVPLAEKLFQKWTSGNPPTQADFDELRAMAAQHASDRMAAQLTAHGVDLGSPLAAALLALSKSAPAAIANSQSPIANAAPMDSVAAAPAADPAAQFAPIPEPIATPAQIAQAQAAVEAEIAKVAPKPVSNVVPVAPLTL